MLGIVTKPQTAVTWTDVTGLLESGGAPEGQTMEFKETLPGKKLDPASGKSVDQWIIDQSDIGNKAKQEVLEEVVAFANRDGGIVVVGIEESNTNPRRAISVNLIPRVHDLAERFSLVLRDSIEPPLQSVEVFGVDAGGGSDGVLVFRVAPSISAPHRYEPTRHCYVRRRDRSEKMTMREIQEMTVLRMRSEENLRQRLEQERRFTAQLPFPVSTTEQAIVTFHVSAVPAVAGLAVKNLAELRSSIKLTRRANLRSSRRGEIITDVFGARLDGLKFRPYLKSYRRIDVDTGVVVGEQLSLSGSITASMRMLLPINGGVPAIYASWLPAMLIAVLSGAEEISGAAGAPGLEFAIDCEIGQNALDPHFTVMDKGGPPVSGKPIAVKHGVRDFDLGLLKEIPFRFPTYSYASGLPNAAGALVAEMYDDLLNATGRESAFIDYDSVTLTVGP